MRKVRVQVHDAFATRYKPHRKCDLFRSSLGPRHFSRCPQFRDNHAIYTDTDM